MNKLHDQATPEEISTHLNDFMKDVGTDESLSSDQEESLNHVISHPNFSKEHYDKILNAYVAPNSISNKEAAGALIDSKHFSPQDASRMLAANVSGGHIDDALSQRLSAVDGVDKTPLEQHALNHINDDSRSVDDTDSYHNLDLKPQFLQELLASRPEYTHGEGLTPEQEAQNRKAHKIDAVALKALMHTSGHTPESLEHAVNLVMNDSIKNHSKSYYSKPGTDEDIQSDLMEDLINNQKGLSQDHLNRLYEKAKSMPESDSWSRNDPAEKVLKHPNVDPILLSKIARKKSEGYRDDELQAALSNPNLPHESINAIINDDEELDEKHRGLFRNPSLTTDQLTALYDKGHADSVINHKNADANFHRRYWNDSDKSTERARSLVDADNTPPDILKEIIGHKNQDVAIQALKHHNADQSVVEAGLQRKAKAVQDEARKHPLVADQEMKRGFAEGKFTLQQALADSHTRKYFDKLSPEEKGAAYEKMAEAYKGTDADAIAEKQKIGQTSVWNQKYHLASNPEVPQHVREQNVNDIVNAFDKSTPNNASSFHYNHDGGKKHNYAAFNNLLKDKNRVAENKAMDKPGYIQHFSDHFDTEDLNQMNPEFLDRVYDRINDSVGEQVVNDDGMVKRLDDKHTDIEKKNLLKSPKVSEKKLDQYLAIRPLDDLTHLLSHHSNVSDGTILDKRYESLPEDEKRQRFEKHLSEGRNMAVAASEQAPQDLRDKAFRLLTPEQQQTLVTEHDNELQGFGDDILRDAMHGRLDNPDLSALAEEKSRRDGISAMEGHALNRLNPNNPNHKALLDEYLTQAAQREGNGWDQPGDTGINSAIKRSWLTDHFDIFKKHAGNFPGLYFSSLKQSMAEKMPHGQLNDEQANEAVSQLQNEAAHYASLGATPEDQKNRLSEFWQRNLESYKNTNDFFSEPIAKIVGHKQKERESNGKLDFLKDLAKEDSTLKNQLLNKQLLSPAAAEDLSNSFRNYGEYLQSLPEAKRKETIRGKVSDYLEGQQADPSQLEYVLNKMTAQSLRGHLGTSSKLSFDKDEMPIVDNNMKKMYDLAQANGKAENYLTALFGNGELTSKDSELLSKSMLQHIIDTSPEETKAQGVAQYYDTLSNIESLSGGSLPGPVLTKVADIASQYGDTKTLADIVQNNGTDLPKNIIGKVNSLAKDSGNLSWKQLGPLSNLFDHEQFSGQSIKSVDHNFENALQKGLQTGELGPSQVAMARSQYISNLADVNQDSSQEKAEAVSSILQKYRTYPDVQGKATVALQKYVSSDKLNIEQRKQIYLSLPDRIMGANSESRSLSRDMVNDPEIMADSTKGWKLASLVTSVDEMNPENISLLANRAMAPETQDDLNAFASNTSWRDWSSGKPYVMSQIAGAPQAKDQDISKMMRSLTPVELKEYVSNVRKDDNLAQSKNHIVLGHISEKLDEMMASPEKFNMEKGQVEHLKGLNEQIDLARSLISKFKFGDDVTNAQEKRESCAKAVKSLTEAHNYMLDESEKSTDVKSDTQRDMYDQAGLTMNYIADSQIPWDGKDLVSIFSTLQRVEKGGTKYPGVDNLRATRTLRSYKAAFANAENVKSDVWQHLASTNGVYPFLLQDAPVISKDMVDHLDYGKLLSKNKTAMDEEFSNWFEKMDKDALQAHGAKILKSISAHLKDNEDGESGSEYWNSIKKGLSFGNRFMDYDQLQDVLSGFSKSIQGRADSVCVRSGAGGSRFAEEAMERNLNSSNKKLDVEDFTSSLMASPAITEKIADKVMESFPMKSDGFVSAYKALANNKNVPQKNLSRIVDTLIQNHREGYRKIDQNTSSEIGVRAMKNPQISWDDLKTLFDETQKDQNIVFTGNSQFHPAFINPKHGSRLLRSLPPTVPEALTKFGISPDKMQRDVIVGGKTRDKLTEAMQGIPPEGMAWPEFKRKFPKMENVQEIKDVFMKKNNKPVMAEDFAKAMRGADEKDKFNAFHVTYSTWGDSDTTGGSQRHNMKSGANLVVQLNSSQKADMEIAQDPKAWALYQMILKNTNGISNEGSVGVHPTTPHLVAWSRVDASNKGAWIIEEFQSDAAQKFRANIREMIKKSPSGLKLEGQEIAPDEIKGYLTKIDKAFENWQKASMEAVMQNAKAHGIKRIYMHGSGVRSQMSGGQYQNGKYMEYSRDFMNPRIKEIYDGNAQKFGFQKCDYTDYPNYSKETHANVTAKGLPTHCWYLDIA